MANRPVTNLDHSVLIGHVGLANAALAEYSGMLQGIVNPNVMLSPLTRQEAVLSSKIEGTQATVEEVMEHEAGAQFDDEKRPGNPMPVLVLVRTFERCLSP